MDVDFVIPLSTDDLLNGEVGCYVVDEVFSINSLPKKMAGKKATACAVFTSLCTVLLDLVVSLFVV